MRPNADTGAETTTSRDLVDRRVHIFLALKEAEGHVPDTTLSQVVTAIDAIRELSNWQCTEVATKGMRRHVPFRIKAD